VIKDALQNPLLIDSRTAQLPPFIRTMMERKPISELTCDIALMSAIAEPNTRTEQDCRPLEDLWNLYEAYAPANVQSLGADLRWYRLHPRMEANPGKPPPWSRHDGSHARRLF